MGHRLLTFLTDQNLILSIANQVNGGCFEVSDLAFVTLGNMLRHGVDIS